MPLFTEQRLNAAYLWVCKQRLNFPAYADIWHLRAHWQQQKHLLLEELQCGQFRFTPLEVIKQPEVKRYIYGVHAMR